MNVVDRRMKTEQWKTLLSRGLSLSLIPIAASLPAVSKNIKLLDLYSNE